MEGGADAGKRREGKQSNINREEEQMKERQAQGPKMKAEILLPSLTAGNTAGVINYLRQVRIKNNIPSR